MEAQAYVMVGEAVRQAAAGATVWMLTAVGISMAAWLVAAGLCGRQV